MCRRDRHANLPELCFSRSRMSFRSLDIFIDHSMSWLQEVTHRTQDKAGGSQEHGTDLGVLLSLVSYQQSLATRNAMQTCCWPEQNLLCDTSFLWQNPSGEVSTLVVVTVKTPLLGHDEQCLKALSPTHGKNGNHRTQQPWSGFVTLRDRSQRNTEAIV